MADINGIHLQEAPPDIMPKCPHCKGELDQIWTKTKGTGFIGKEQILICPHCQALLGYSTYRR